jgi:hypothetical protein
MFRQSSSPSISELKIPMAVKLLWHTQRNNLCQSDKRVENLNLAKEIIKKAANSESQFSLAIQEEKRLIDAFLEIKKSLETMQFFEIECVVNWQVIYDLLLNLNAENFKILEHDIDSSIQSLSAEITEVKNQIEKNRYDQACVADIPTIIKEKTNINSWGWINCRYDRLQDKLEIEIPGNDVNTAYGLFPFLDKSEMQVTEKKDGFNNPSLVIQMETECYEKILIAFGDQNPEVKDLSSQLASLQKRKGSLENVINALTASLQEVLSKEVEVKSKITCIIEPAGQCKTDKKAVVYVESFRPEF